MPVLLVFIGFPLIEIAAFTAVGQALGLWPTVALALAAGLLGAALLRIQGVATLRRMIAKLERGEAAVTEAVEGVWLVLAGLLLITPGFITDFIGLLLFLPPVRRWAGRWLIKFLLRHGEVNIMVNGQATPMTEADLDPAARSGKMARIERIGQAPAHEPDQTQTACEPDVEVLPPINSKWGSPHSRFRS